MNVKKPKTALITLLYIVALALGCGITALYYRDVYSVIFAAGGAVSLWIFTSLCHELGHVIAAKASGFEIIAFSCCGFRFDKTARVKFKFNPFSRVAGETAVIPDKARSGCENGEKYPVITLAGLIAHALTIIGYMLALVLCDNLLAKEFFAFFTLPLASFIVNGCKFFIPTSDAAVLAGFTSYKGEADAYDAYLNVLRFLRDGKTYAEIDGRYFAYGECSSRLKAVMRLFSLRREEELGNMEDARLKAENTPFGDVSDVEAQAEFLFIGYVSGSEDLISRYGAVAESLDGCDEPFAQRLRLAKAKYAGDETYVKVAKPTALKSCENEFFVGDGRFNKKIIENI